MNRFLTVIPCLLLAGGLAACAGSSTKTATVTVTTTVTVTATPTGSAAADSSVTDSAVSDPTSAPAPDSGPDACSLLTQAQADAIASTPLQKGTGAGKNASGAFVMCQWIGLTNGPTAELEVYVGDGAKQQLHIDRDNLGHKMNSIPRIGDECLQEDGFIFAQRNGLWVSIHLVRLNDAAQNIMPMQNGMKAVVAKLP